MRSMALSSAELWHDLLQRLTEVQESQAALARAIEDLGSIVRSALSSVGSTGTRPALGPENLQEGLEPGPPRPSAQTPAAPRTPAALGAKPDVLSALLGSPPTPTYPAPAPASTAPGAKPPDAGGADEGHFDSFAPPPPGPSMAASGAAPGATSMQGIPPDVPEPLFYVPPLMEEHALGPEGAPPADVRPQPPGSPAGAEPPLPAEPLPGTARAEQASPALVGPPVVLPPLATHLSPDAVDDVLAREFGQAAAAVAPVALSGAPSGAPSGMSPRQAPPPPEPLSQAPSSQGDLLDTLLGKEFLPVSAPTGPAPGLHSGPALVEERHSAPGGIAPPPSFASPPLAPPPSFAPPPAPPGFQVRPEAILGLPQQPARAPEQSYAPLTTTQNAPPAPPSPPPSFASPPPPPGSEMPPPAFGTEGDQQSAPRWQPPPGGGAPSQAMSLASEILGAAPGSPAGEEPPAEDNRPIAQDLTVFGKGRGRRGRRKH